MSYIKICELKDFGAAKHLGVRAGSVNLVVIHLDGAVHAYEDQCAHRGVKLSFGSLNGGVLQCPAHQWEYNAATGQGITQPLAQLRKFAARLDGDDVLVDLG